MVTSNTPTLWCMKAHWSQTLFIRLKSESPNWFPANRCIKSNVSLCFRCEEEIVYFHTLNEVKQNCRRLCRRFSRQTGQKWPSMLPVLRSLGNHFCHSWGKNAKYKYSKLLDLFQLETPQKGSYLNYMCSLQNISYGLPYILKRLGLFTGLYYRVRSSWIVNLLS